MTNKYLSGAYPGGYTLNATYTGLVIESSASVGGTGVMASFATTIQNFGLVDAASGYGVTLAGGAVTNGSAADTTALIEGAGGVLVQDASAAITNFGTINASAHYGVMLDAGGTVTNGSEADRTAQIQGVATHGAPATLINYGTISGENTGVYLVASGTVINGSETDKRAVIIGGLRGIDEKAYVPTTVTNFGTISAKYGGVQLGGGGSVTNGSATDPTALITGFVYVSSFAGRDGTVTNFGTIGGGVSSRTVVNFGTIIGGVGFPHYVGHLTAEAGSAILGVMYGDGGTLELAGGTGTISGMGSKSGTITGAVTAGFFGFGSYAMDAGSSWTLSGTNTLAAGRPLADNGAITNEGALTLDWTVSGAGTLTFAGGTETMNTGAAVGTTSWTISGGTARLNESLTYAGAFSEGAGAVITVAASQRLTLRGAASLGGTLDGGGKTAVFNATLNGLTVGGTAGLRVTGTATQTGTVTIGDATTNHAFVFINEGATYTIDGAVGIARGSSTSSGLRVFGTLIKSGAAGVSVIAVKTIDTGVIEAATGTLDFSNTLTGDGSMKIDAGATLEVDSAAASTLTVRFIDSNGTLALAEPSRFAATLHGFAPTDTIDLLNTLATAATLGTGDTLVISNAAHTVATLQLGGTYTGDAFNVASDGQGGSNITVTTPGGANEVPIAGHRFIAAMAGLAGSAGGAIHSNHTTPVREPMLSKPRAMIA
jgi:hypothetical protein